MRKVTQYTFTEDDEYVVDPNATYIEVMLKGAGGGGGDTPGGDGGQMMGQFTPLELDPSVLLKVGKGGLPYSHGGDTVFGRYLIAYGGGAGRGVGEGKAGEDGVLIVTEHFNPDKT